MNPRKLWALAVGSVLTLAAWSDAQAADPTVERGRYLIAIGGCSDCHTRGYFLGNTDVAHRFAGSDVGFEIPSLGVFYGPNLTPDKETGLGAWTDSQIAAAITAGVRPDGRRLAPIMPWRSFAILTKPDIDAIIAYLRSLPAVSNRVPGPFGPQEVPTSYVMKVVPPQAQDVAIETGGTLAGHWCAACHDVTRAAQAVSADGAPTFRSIASRTSTSSVELDRYLSSGHTRMPDFVLSAYERRLLIGYILSLR